VYLIGSGLTAATARGGYWFIFLYIAAGNLGIKDDFRQRVQDLVQPGTSAILVIVRKVTTDKFLEAMRPYGGTVLQTSLPHGTEQQLMKALHGDDPAAPTWEQSASAGATT
jgi:uncharacterized membrane protein